MISVRHRFIPLGHWTADIYPPAPKGVEFPSAADGAVASICIDILTRSRVLGVSILVKDYLEDMFNDA